MLAKVGDIYSVFSPLLQQYVACQVTQIKPASSPRDTPLAAVLELDWSGDALPTAAEVAAMQPLLCDYYFWNRKYDHLYLSANVPPGHVLIANIAPLVEREVNSYGSTWNVGDSLARHRRWQQLDPVARERFKSASDQVEVKLGEHCFRQTATRITDNVLQSLSSLDELDQLPCMMTVETQHGTPELLDYLLRRPLVHELHWQSDSMPELDLRSSNLKRLVLNPQGVTDVKLNDSLDFLSLTSLPTAALQVEAADAGRLLTLQCVQALPSLTGLNRLDGLSLTGVETLDVEQVVQRFPALMQLRLWGKPGSVSNIGALARLDNLQMLSTYDIFGFDGGDFPKAEQLPQLSSLWMSSLPAEAAKAIKAGYKKAVAHGLDLSIRQPRKPEWLAENLLNPFRDWDGREQISAANAKKAAQAYKAMLAATRGIEASNAPAVLDAMVRDYVAVFNKMERSGIIETVEREEICDVLATLLTQLRKQGLQFDQEALFELMDSLRDF